jgi:hypothetical protein
MAIHKEQKDGVPRFTSQERHIEEKPSVQRFITDNPTPTGTQ